MNVNNKFKWVLLFTVCCMSWGWLTSSVEAEGYGTANSDEYLNKIAISAPGTEFYTGSMTFRPDTSNEFLIDGFQNNNGIQIAVTLNRQDPNIVYIHELGPRDDIRNKYTLSKGGTVNSKILVGHRYKYLSDYPNLLFERYDNSKSLWKLKRNLLRNDTETYGKAVVPLPTKINQNIDYIVAGSAQVDPESGKLIQGDKLLRTQNQWGYQGENYTTSAPETITRDGKIYKLVQKLPENQNGKMSAYIDGWTATYWYGTYGLRYTQIDDTGLQLVELLRPNQSVEQSVTLAPGERHVFPNKGTAKGPVNAVNVYNGQDLESYEIVYEYEEQGGAKTRPVDSDGNEITHDNLEFPRIHGNPGEKVMIDPNDLPNLLGYHKPKNSFEVIIPQEGGVIDIPYQSAKEMPEVKDGKSNNRDYEWYIDQASVSGNQPLVTCTVMAIKWYNETSEVTVEDALKWNEKSGMRCKFSFTCIIIRYLHG